MLLILSACSSHRPPVEQRSIGQRNNLEQPTAPPRTQARPAQPAAKPGPAVEPKKIAPDGRVYPQVNQPAATLRQSVVAKARSVIGTPYRFGGMSPVSGFDCSGLVVWVYETHGVDLPRTTWEQTRAGQAVPADQMHPGDIVVFKLGGKQPYLHTGIYAGGNTFIHSPRSGGRVREESLSGAYWAGRIHAVRRVIK
ncbi:cell wall-associated hydrolase, invasion-associated protein [Desulfocurvibacter africanus PCS]|uniref:Cell wall-associated hydrolase, invasion-associated protein n=1 Tax=Desulfocurvibacter africanus PCS TaxID=1262666 RepID=M5PP18_DESAF|nr:cell wall-associated hydrolase, invasion-associated protein [Desulfocurvibacter africanus PCS]